MDDSIMDLDSLDTLDNPVPPSATPTQAFLLMQMERIQSLEMQLSQMQKAYAELVDIVRRSSGENLRFLKTLEHGIVSIGKSDISDLVGTVADIHNAINNIKITD